MQSLFIFSWFIPHHFILLLLLSLLLLIKFLLVINFIHCFLFLFMSLFCYQAKCIFPFCLFVVDECKMVDEIWILCDPSPSGLNRIYCSSRQEKHQIEVWNFILISSIQYWILACWPFNCTPNFMCISNSWENLFDPSTL